VGRSLLRFVGEAGCRCSGRVGNTHTSSAGVAFAQMSEGGVGFLFHPLGYDVVHQEYVRGLCVRMMALVVDAMHDRWEPLFVNFADHPVLRVLGPTAENENENERLNADIAAAKTVEEARRAVRAAQEARPAKRRAATSCGLPSARHVGTRTPTRVQQGGRSRRHQQPPQRWGKSRR
jgi:hypothetical protein